MIIKALLAAAGAAALWSAPAFAARSYTHCSIGRPPMDRSTLPGRRTEARRAGMTTRNIACRDSQRASSGSSAASWRASSAIITGTSSRTG